MDPLKDTESRLAALCKEVRWRTRLNRALAQVTPVGAVALWILALGLAADGLLLVPSPLSPWCALAGGLLWSSAVWVGWMETVTDVVACQRLDQQARLEGRLANARAFLGRGTSGGLSPMEQAAVRDAARALASAEPRAVEPLRRPPISRAFLGALVACVLAVGLSRTVAPMDASGLSALSLPRSPTFRVRVEEPADLLQLTADARHSKEAASRAGDPQVRQWLEALNQLIQDVASGRLSAERAHARIAALERAQEAWEASVGDARTVEEHLRSAGARTSRPTKHLRSTVEALRAAQWEEGAQALEAAAEDAAGERSERSRHRLSQGLDALARRLATERQRTEQRARKERRRLRRKEKKQGRLSRKDRRRLNRQERQLEKLDRQRAEMGKMERTLERLQREMERAAQASRRRGEGTKPEVAEAMKRAAEAMRRMGQLSRGRRQLRISKARLKELRELLRRAARGQDQRRGQPPGGGDGEDGEDSRTRFLRLALGQGQGGQGEGAGSSPTFELAPGGGEGGEQVQWTAGADRASGGTGDGASSGLEAGDGVDPELYGEAERGTVQTKSDHVSGKEGAGASQTRVVLSAARAGFVTARWKEVHQDYSQVVEEAMERQHIPSGRRQYVREYFDLIRPR